MQTLPRSSALQAVNAVASPAKVQSAVPCPDAAALFNEYTALLDAAEQLSNACPAADLADTSYSSPAAGNGTAASAPAEARREPASAPSDAEPVSVFALDQAMLLGEPELTLLVLIRMLATVSRASSVGAGDAGASDQPAESGSAAEGTADQGEVALTRLAGMLQVAADGLHVATHCVLACKPVVLPAAPPASAKVLVQEWLTHVRGVVSQLAQGSAASPCTADTVQQVTDALAKSSLASNDCVTPDASPALASCAGPPGPTSAFVTPAASPLTPVLSGDSFPRLRAGLAFLESQCFPRPDAAAAWYGPMYSWLRDSAAAVRKEGAAVFQNLLSACSDQGVPVLHEAVLASDVDAVELLLMLGASPLQRAPLADGTEVHWRHGITTPHSMPAPVLCSNTAVRQHLQALVSRPAAWQPVLKSAAGATSSAGGTAAASVHVSTADAGGFASCPTPEQPASADKIAASASPAAQSAPLADSKQQAVVRSSGEGSHSGDKALAESIRAEPHLWPQWLQAAPSKSCAPACGPVLQAGMLGPRSTSTRPPDDVEAAAAFDEVRSTQAHAMPSSMKRLCVVHRAT